MVRMVKQHGHEEIHLCFWWYCWSSTWVQQLYWRIPAIRGEDLAAKAQEAKRRAEEKIQNQHGDMDFAQAASELAKAIAQLRVID